MARSRSYDDMSDDRFSKKSSSSTRIVVVVILLSVLICMGAFFIWAKLEEVSNSGSVPSPDVSNIAVDNDVPQEENVEAAPESQVVVSVAEEPAPDLSIDSGISVLSGSSTLETDYITSSDYVIPEESEDSELFEESVEMKKPVIAQNLSISQQSFAKDIVMYQEYMIQKDDSLKSIADRFGLSTETLVAVNQINSTKDLWVGRILQIPDRDGTLYIVSEGDTLLSITQQMGLAISPKTLGDVNGIFEDNLVPGQKLFIPYETLESSGTITASAEPSFRLPTDGKTVGLFNTKVADPMGNGSIKLDGILLQAEPGSEVLAAESGTVVDKVFNDNGTLSVKIMHASGYTSFYDYLGTVYVDVADNVAKGQVIGTFADSMDNYDQPIIFFRIEEGGVAFDPYSFLN